MQCYTVNKLTTLALVDNMRIEKVYKQIGARLRSLREAADLTQEQVAKRMRLSRTSIVNIENGHQRILTHTLFDFAKLFKVDAALLVSDTAIDYAPMVEQVVKAQWARARAAIETELDSAETAVLRAARR